MKRKNKDEENEVKKPLNKKRLLLIILILVILILSGIYMYPFLLFGSNNKKRNDDNIKYLLDRYDNKLTVSFVSRKKKVWTYEVCAKNSSFCGEIKYKKNWIYPLGEGFIYTLIFMDNAVDTLRRNNIEYTTYTNNKSVFTRPNNLILVIKKDNAASLVNAIKEINNDKVIGSLCSKIDDNKCTGRFEINIFNKDDYELITSSIKKSYGIDSYYKFYEILYEKEENRFGTRLGNNVVRHNIDNNMFSCNIPECNNYKYLAYRYVIGNHNMVNNTIIIEGIK